MKTVAHIVLEHQVGNETNHIDLHGKWANSTWLVFARIAIQRIS